MHMVHMHTMYVVKHFKEMNSNVHVGMTIVKKEQKQDYFSQHKIFFSHYTCLQVLLISHFRPAYLCATVSLFHECYFHSWIANVLLYTIIR